MDRVPATAVEVCVVQRGCTSCEHSLLLSPNWRELARGVVEVTVCCLHPKALLRMPDGVYPRLASVCRSSSAMCGGRGKWWEKETGPKLAEVTDTTTTGLADRRARAEQVKKDKQPRTPYKL